MSSIIDRIDDVIEDWVTSPDAMHWTADPPKFPVGTVIRGSVTVDLTPIGVAFRQFSDDLLPLVEAVRAAGVAFSRLSTVKRAWRRKPPRSLCIDGAAYRRRTQARRRRG